MEISHLRFPFFKDKNMKIRLKTNYASPRFAAQAGAIVSVDEIEGKALIKGNYAELADTYSEVVNEVTLDEVLKEEIEEEPQTEEKAVNQTILRRKTARKII